ncbi:hypothetical protein SDC9_42730 [bioreactor metagenome]|uniref:Uncharacterized protein n=1 Tax=bioreactor metagenome TaxID=1076179 RepID=A0A644VYV5_9ZZZZ
MTDETIKVRFRHPLDGTALELVLPASATFGEVLKMLCRNGFIQEKPAGYGFIIDQHLCALNKSLISYVPPETKDVVDIEINGMLTIMT